MALSDNIVLLTAGIGIVGSACVGIGLVMRHVQILHRLGTVMSRVPLVLLDEMVHTSTATTKPVTKRAVKRFTCNLFLKNEDYNKQLASARHRYQLANTYALKSAVGLVAIVIWILTFLIPGMYFAGQQNNAASAGSRSGQTNQVNIQMSLANAPAGQANNTNNTNAAPNLAASTSASAIAPSDSAVAKSASIRLSVWAAIAAAVWFAALLIVCYHFGVYGKLVDDVIILCRDVGLISQKTEATGKLVMGEIIAADDDPEFKQLLARLNKE
jgi:hypothetical protein